MYSKRGFDSHCDNSGDPAITFKTINKIIRYIYKNPKYKKDCEYNFSRCPVKFPNEPVKTYTSINKLNKDYLNSTADFE